MNGYFDRMSDFKDDFIENLIFYRTQKGLSQLELSGICDCAKSTIGGIESRKNFPSRAQVRDFFEKDIMDLVEKRFPTAQSEE